VQTKTNVLLLACLLVARAASATGIVVESHVGARADDAATLLAPIYGELEHRGYLTRAALGRLYEKRVSRGASEGDPLSMDFVSSVDRGHKAAIDNKASDAIATLTPLVAEAQAHSPVIAQSQLLREAYQKALLGLALAQHHSGDVDAAKTTLLELLRTYPDLHIARSIYGAELAAFSEDVRRSIKERGALTVQVGENAVVFMNERFVNIGPASRRELVPGVYRVFAQLSKTQVSRVHYVEVRAGQETTVSFDAAYETAVMTSSGWTGLVFPTATEHDARSDVFVARVAREVEATSAIVLGVETMKGRTSVTGAQIDIASGRQLRRATVLVSPTTSDERLLALAVFLAGGKSAAGVDVAINGEADSDVVDMTSEESGGEESPEPPSRSAAQGRPWMLWAGIGAVVVGAAAGGGLALKFHGDATATGEELTTVCAVSCTPQQVRALDDSQSRANHNATLSMVAGGAVVVTGVVLIVMSRFDHNDSSSVAVSPVSGGAVGSYVTSF
jgi:hypothetical protein